MGDKSDAGGLVVGVAKVVLTPLRYVRAVAFKLYAKRHADHYHLEDGTLLGIWPAGAYCPRCLDGESGKPTPMNFHPDAAPGCPELVCPVCRYAASAKPGGGYKRAEDGPSDWVRSAMRRPR